MVSIVCLTYNHGPYIERAIKSFVCQKTSFKFEILIHDDASTDDTPNIIKQYQSLYPNLIKPIFQKNNQYSKGVCISETYVAPLIKGKYVAICEGDDFWTDENKLQIQFEALEAHQDVDICAHSTEGVSDDGSIKQDICPSSVDRLFSLSEVIIGGGGFVSTNSLFLRKHIFYNDKEPLFRKCLRLDYTLQIYGSMRGGMLYLHNKMSAFRWLARGSWSERINNDDSMYVAFERQKKEMLVCLNKETSFKYQSAIERRILIDEYYFFLHVHDYRKALRLRYRFCFSKEHFWKKIKILMKSVFLNRTYKA